jgi:hypothetical protein
VRHAADATSGGAVMRRWPTVTLGTILLIILLLILVGALPAWPYSRGWGF